MGAVQFVPSGTATVVEIYVAIIGACLPTLAPIYRLLRYGDPLKTNTTGLSLPAKGTSARRLPGQGSFERLSNIEHNFMPGDYDENRRVHISSSRDEYPLKTYHGEDYQTEGVMVTQQMVWSEHKQSPGVVC